MNIQWLKFGVLLIISILNLILGLLIFKKNITKDRAKIYFSMMCFSASMWILASSIIQIAKNQILFLWADRFIYFFAALIIFFFWLFSNEFIYKSDKLFYTKKIIITIITIMILSLTLSKILITGNYSLGNALYQTENKLVNLFYGIYFIALFISSCYIILKKYIKSCGINKYSLQIIMLGTIPSFIIATIFCWYLPYAGKHYLYWIGTIFALPMNFSIAYLLFKRD